MCDECGCSSDENTRVNEDDSRKTIILDRKVTEANNLIAHHISHALKDKNIFCINILGSPGSGKTTLIEQLSAYLAPSSFSVIQGDLESDIDKKRLESQNIDTYQINTHSGCHLNAAMIKKALQETNLREKKYLLIENVGNLVCPAGVLIGQHMNLIVSSTAEGSDKPKKYPLIFMDAKLILISKYDLKDAVRFDEKKYIADIRDINGTAKIITTSLNDRHTFREVAHFIEHERDHFFGSHHHH